jgi:hypothetical protein
VITQITNFSSFNYTVKKSITLSGTTTIPNGQNISLRAQDFIEFKDGFVLPNSSMDIVFNTNECD